MTGQCWHTRSRSELMQFPQVRPAPVCRATSATHRAPFAMDSSTSLSVTTARILQLLMETLNERPLLYGAQLARDPEPAEKTG